MSCRTFYRENINNKITYKAVDVNKKELRLVKVTKIYIIIKVYFTAGNLSWLDTKKKILYNEQMKNSFTTRFIHIVL